MLLLVVLLGENRQLLKNLADAHGIEVRPANPDDHRVTLVFAVDLPYLRYLETLAFSMISAGAFIHAQVALITSDSAVKESRLARELADRIIVLEGETEQALSRLAAGLTRRKDPHGNTERSRWTAGTLLKWAVFRDWSTEYALFMDADMIVLGGFEDILQLGRPDAIVGVSQFSRRLVDDEDRQHRPEAEVAKALDELLRLGHTAIHGVGRSLNSGMMLVGRDLLDTATLDEALKFAEASDEVFVNEQKLLTRFIEGSERFSIVRAPARYNFQDGYFRGVSLGEQLRILGQVRILHYAGPTKPWSRSIDEKTTVAKQLWWLTDRRARQAFGTQEAGRPAPEAVGIATPARVEAVFHMIRKSAYALSGRKGKRR